MEIKLYNRPPTYKGYTKDIYIYNGDEQNTWDELVLYSNWFNRKNWRKSH